MTDKTGFVQTLSVEVRFARGIGYLNRCGHLAQKLQDLLGAPFRMNGLPTVEVGEFRSEPERLIVRFGRESFSVIQLGPHTAARVEQIAPKAWECVRDDLQVGRDVTRCGLRVIAMWPTADIKAARETLARTGMVAASEKWASLFGAPSWSTFTGVSSDSRKGDTRVAIDSIETRTEGPQLVGYEGLYPPASVQLDIDYVYANEGRANYSLGPGQLSDFIRSRWESAKTLRTAFANLLAPVDS